MSPKDSFERCNRKTGLNVSVIILLAALMTLSMLGPTVYGEPAEAQPKAPSTISISVSSEVVGVGEPVEVSGAISPPHANVTVCINYVAYPASVPHYVTTNPDGSFTHTRIFKGAGSWKVTASWQGDSDHEGATSPTVSIQVEVLPMPLTIGLVVAILAAVAGVIALKKNFIFKFGAVKKSLKNGVI